MRKLKTGSIEYDIAHKERLHFGVGRSAFAGCFTLEVTHHSFCGPIGCIWYRFTHNATCIDVLNSYVDPRFRRLGLRTLLNQRLFECYPAITRITTDGGSSDGGTAFIKSVGYRKLPNGTGWELRRKSQ